MVWVRGMDMHMGSEGGPGPDWTTRLSGVESWICRPYRLVLGWVKSGFTHGDAIFSDYKKTSMAAHVRIFEAFVHDLQDSLPKGQQGEPHDFL